MAYAPEVNAQRYPTLVDVSKRLDPNGSVASIAELLNETNEVLDDAVYVEGNLPTGHRTTIRSGLPSATWRRLNYGVKPTKSKTVQVTDTIGMLEDYAEIDKDLAMLNGNTAAFRLSEDQPHLEAISQTLASTIFYGDTDTDPERFMGLAARYATLGTPTGKPSATTYGDHVIDAGGTGSNLTSIWLVVWGPNTVHMVYPKGSKAGILHKDLGEQTLFDDDGGRFQGFRTHYQVKTGMSVRDWRYVVRIANVDPTATLDYKLLIQAINTIPNIKMGRAAFYCTRSVKTQLDYAAAEKSNVLLSIKEVFGMPQTGFWNIPLRQTDGILETESALT